MFPNNVLDMDDIIAVLVEDMVPLVVALEGAIGISEVAIAITISRIVGDIAGVASTTATGIRT